jgi:hypothetical protein
MSLALAELCDQKNNVRVSTNTDSNDYNKNKFELFKNDIDNSIINKCMDIDNQNDFYRKDDNDGKNRNISLNFNANEQYEEKTQYNKNNVFSNESYLHSMNNIENNELHNLFEIQNKSNIGAKAKIDNKKMNVKSEENIVKNIENENEKNEKNKDNFSVSDIVARVLANLKGKNSVDNTDKKYRGQRRIFLDEETERVSRIMLGTMAKSNR